MDEIKIGKQIWMTHNLHSVKFRNGDPIPEVKTDRQWRNAGEKGLPARCFYDNKRTNGLTLGILYNWFAVTDPRGLAPIDWHVPDDAEWKKLIKYLGGEDAAILKMKSIHGWNNGHNGNNLSGFSGLPGGYRDNSGSFYDLGTLGIWWSTTEYATYNAGCHELYSYYGEVIRDYSHEKQKGFSVRCIRD